MMVISMSAVLSSGDFNAFNTIFPFVGPLVCREMFFD